MIIEVQCTSLTREKVASREQNNVVWLFKGDMGKIGKVQDYPLKVVGVLELKKYVCTTKTGYWFFPTNPVYLIVDGYIYRIIKKIAKTYFVMEQTDHLGSDESCFDFGKFPEKDRFYQELVKVSERNGNTMSFDTDAPRAELFLCEGCQKEGVIITAKFGVGEKFCDCVANKEKHPKRVNTPCYRDPKDETPEEDIPVPEQKSSTQEPKWEKMMVDFLKKACKERGLKVSGKKAELVHRLRNPEEEAGWNLERRRYGTIGGKHVSRDETSSSEEDTSASRQVAEEKSPAKTSEWEKMRVEELKEACKLRGLMVNGTKSQLVHRLENPNYQDVWSIWKIKEACIQEGLEEFLHTSRAEMIYELECVEAYKSLYKNNEDSD